MSNVQYSSKLIKELADCADRLMRLSLMTTDCKGSYEPSRIAYAQLRQAVYNVRIMLEGQPGTADLPHMSLVGTPVIVQRTSNKKDKPCDEAVLRPFVYVDRRSAHILSEGYAEDAHMLSEGCAKDAWYSQGRNHREEKGGAVVARDLEERERWTVSFDSYADFETFCEKYGEVVISVDRTVPGACFRLEIYDEHRE